MVLSRFRTVAMSLWDLLTANRQHEYRRSKVSAVLPETLGGFGGSVYR